MNVVCAKTVRRIIRNGSQIAVKMHFLGPGNVCVLEQSIISGILGKQDALTGRDILLRM